MKKEQGAKVIFLLPPLYKCPICCALSKALSSANFHWETGVKLSLEKVRKDQSFFSNLAWRCETFRKVPRSRAVIWFKCPCTHMRYRLRHFLPKTHVSKPCSPVHVSPHLSTFEIQNYFRHDVSGPKFSFRRVSNPLVIRACVREREHMQHCKHRR